MSEMILTSDLYDVMKETNRIGNRVRWTSDKDLWGVDELWEFPKDVKGTLKEDCDGITLYKMKMLIDHGFSPNHLLMVVCVTEGGEGHAVLCVRTHRGDFILDNRYPDIKTIEELKRIGYRFLYRSTGNLLGEWEKLK